MAGAFCDGLRLTLRDPQRRPMKTGEVFSDFDDGFEFRAKATGTYYFEVAETRSENCSDGSDDYPSEYRLRAAPDCPAGPSTKCRLKPGASQQRYFAFSADSDWFAVTLDRRRTYAVRLEFGGTWPELAILDAAGGVLAQSYSGSIEGFSPTRTGRYFVRASGEDDVAQQYRITLALSP